MVKADFVFKEGMYLYLNCSFIDSSWHPFTISSAVGDLERSNDPYISVHIRCTKSGGWTDQLKNYFEAMNPKKMYPLLLTRRDPGSGKELPGKLNGIDGQPILRVDGPHAAPGMVQCP
jgi:hypothetical protein